MKEIVILGGARTPIGSFMGTLSSLPAPKLGAIAIRCALENSGVEAGQIQQVIMGNVLQAGIGQAPARQAGIYAGVPVSAGAVTVNKVCGSGLKALMYAANDIRCGEYEIAIAGGMESMSNAPYALPQARSGYRMGNGKMLDLMVHDGLWDPYGDKHMGNCAETCVTKYAFTREEQDAFARESYRRAQDATKSGQFKKEIAVVEVAGKKGSSMVVDDEEPFAAPLDKMSTLRPAFDKNGSVTAANASKINDGAAALVVTSAEHAQQKGLRPMARIVAQATAAHEPEWFTTAPAKAIDIVLQRAGMSVGDIDLFEVNEAFAAVALAAMKDAAIPHDKLNVNGGAVALGHPIGASGARIIVTLMYALQQRNLKRGLAAICIGGGEAAAMIIEMVLEPRGAAFGPCRFASRASAGSSGQPVGEAGEAREFVAGCAARQRQFAEAIDPGVLDAQGVGRKDVVDAALRCMEPAQAGRPFARREKVRRRRLVGAELLCGDHEIELDGDVFPRLREQIVIDVREDAEAVAGVAEALEGRIRVGEGEPGGKARREEPGAFVGERPAEHPRDACRGLLKHVAVDPVALVLDERLDHAVGAKDRGGVQPDAVLRRGTEKGLRDPASPVDQGSVTVERDDVEVPCHL
jgi:acetyl-CoA C-acetyltransferase